MARHRSPQPKRMASGRDRGGLGGDWDPLAVLALAMLASREWEKLKPADEGAASTDGSDAGWSRKHGERESSRSARRSVGSRGRAKRAPEPDDYSAPRRRRIRT